LTQTQSATAATAAIARDSLRLALPKGRMETAVLRLLDDAGIDVHLGSRAYRPTVSLDHVESKMLKPQAIVQMLHAGSRDFGFTGADWVRELDAELIELLDTGLDPVRIVAAASQSVLDGDDLPSRPLIIASEFENLPRQWAMQRGLDARFVRSYGATEVFPPEDADCIIDVTATGATLAANDLVIVDELMRSSTRLFASRAAMDDPSRRRPIEEFAVLIESVLEARWRVMLEVNVQPDSIEALIDLLPCMREPTIALLHGDAGFAVKAAVPRREVPALIPLIRSCGGTDVVITETAQIIP